MPLRKRPHRTAIVAQQSPFKDEDRWAPISAERLKQAREAAGLTLRELASRLPGGDLGLTHGRLSQIEKAGGTHRTSVAAVKALARALHVQVAWLGGEPGAFPIRGFRFPPLLSGQPDPGPVGSDLRRAVFTNRCLGAARRDWLREGRKTEGPDWLRMQWWLLDRFWLLPELVENAAGLVPLPSFQLTAPPPEGSRQRPEPWIKAAISYWSVVLGPWWEGRLELDWRALGRLPWEPRPGARSGSVGDALHAAQGGWPLPADLTGLPVGMEMPASEEDLARREAEQKAIALDLIKTARKAGRPMTEDERLEFLAVRNRSPASGSRPPP